MPADHSGYGRDDAWFSPTAELPVVASSPPGVVYTSKPPERPSPRDPYQPLRDIDDDSPMWPMDDPGGAPPRPPAGGFRPFVIGLLVGAALAVVSVIGFQLLRPDDAATPETVPAAGATVAPTVAATSTPTTEPPAESTTSLAETTTSTTPPPEIAAVGTPLAIEQLRLAANAIGPIQFGTSEAEALGRLVASLGPPDADSGEFTSTGELGTCAGDTIRVVQWGPLAVATVPRDAARVLGGFRVDLALGGLDSRAATISTLSGLRAGDSVGDLLSIYSDFTVDFLEEPDLGLIFELRQAGQASLLLWGPVTSAEEDGRVTGIFAPDSCGSATG